MALSLGSGIMEINLMNEMIDYIEDHLTEEISYQKLSKIVGMNEFLMQRVFSLVTGISIAEYIRKRRLSKALEEIQNTDQKIIDIAIKYQYSSSIPFTRALKKEFGNTPSEYRRNHQKYNQFLKLHFEKMEGKLLEYEIRKQKEMTLWVKKIEAEAPDHFHYKIRKLYKELKKTKFYELWNQVGMYAIWLYQDNTYYYFVGSKEPMEKKKKITLPASKYAVFSVGSREQKDIMNMNHLVYHEWLPSTNFSIKDTPCFEYYQEDNCEIGVPIDSKQD